MTDLQFQCFTNIVCSLPCDIAKSNTCLFFVFVVF